MKKKKTTLSFEVEVDLIWRAVGLIEIYWSLAHEYTNTTLCACFSLLLEHDFQIRGAAPKEECLTAIFSMGKNNGREDKIINEMKCCLFYTVVFNK